MTPLYFVTAIILALLAGYGWCRWKVVQLEAQRAREHRAEDHRQATWTIYADEAERRLHECGETIKVQRETIDDLRSGRSLERTEEQRDQALAQIDQLSRELDAMESALQAERVERERVEKIAIELDANYEDILAKYRGVPVAFRATTAQLEALTDTPVPLVEDEQFPPVSGALTGDSGMYSRIDIEAFKEANAAALGPVVASIKLDATAIAAQWAARAAGAVAAKSYPAKPKPGRRTTRRNRKANAR
jgi:hypothetical protein